MTEVTLGLARDEDHRYTAFYPPAEPVALRSVTTLLNVVAKPALLNWYGSIAAGWAVDNVELMQRMAVDLGRDATVKAVAARGRAERDRKAKIGTDAHKAIEAILAGRRPVLDANTAPLVEQYRAFRKEWDFRPIWSEAMVCNLAYGYAGTFDLYGLLEGRRVLVDIKTGSFIAPEMGLQLSAYAGAEFIGKPGTVDRWQMPPVDVYLILQLQPTYYKLIPFDVDKTAFASFLAAKEIDRWLGAEGRRIIGQPLQKGMLRIA